MKRIIICLLLLCWLTSPALATDNLYMSVDAGGGTGIGIGYIVNNDITFHANYLDTHDNDYFYRSGIPASSAGLIGTDTKNSIKSFDLQIHKTFILNPKLNFYSFIGCKFWERNELTSIFTATQVIDNSTVPPTITYPVTQTDINVETSGIDPLLGIGIRTNYPVINGAINYTYTDAGGYDLSTTSFRLIYNF